MLGMLPVKARVSGTHTSTASFGFCVSRASFLLVNTLEASLNLNTRYNPLNRPQNLSSVAACLKVYANSSSGRGRRTAGEEEM